MTQDYTVYFEIFGKKLKTTVFAENEEEVKRKVIEKIRFIKVERDKKITFNKTVDIFEDLLNKF